MFLADVALIRALADNTGLTGGLSEALASGRLLVHDRGRDRLEPHQRPRASSLNRAA